MTTQTRLRTALAGITAVRAALHDPLPDADAVTAGPHLSGLGVILAAACGRLATGIEAVERTEPKQETENADTA
jgi:hypothetical protein